jgi:folylpolyglutamate synthase/dihydropteroate synthase
MTAHLASRRPTIIQDPFQALDSALELARESDAVFVTGSLYLVGDLRSHWRNRKLATPYAPEYR